jgi:hypothetical protein
MAHLFYFPGYQALSTSGTPLAGAKLSFFQTGTTTPANVFANAARTTALSNPVIADGQGRFPQIYADPAVAYRVRLTDSVNVQQWQEDGVSLELFPSTDAEIAAGIVPVNHAYPPYVRGRYATWTDWAGACNGAGAEGSLEKDYALTDPVVLPRKCDFKGFQLTGAHDSIHQLTWSGWVKGWRAKRPKVLGCFFCQYTGIDTGTDDTGFVEVMGGDGTTNPGTFWCKFEIAYTTILTLNADRFDINFNTFWGGIAASCVSPGEAELRAGPSMRICSGASTQASTRE